MTNKTKEIKALIEMSKALGVAVDPQLEIELRKLKEQKTSDLARKIREQKVPREQEESVEKISEVIYEEVLVQPELEAEPEIDLVKEAYEILKQKTRLTESVNLEARIKGIEQYLSRTYLGSYGSGEVRLKNLDDVDRYSVGSPDHALKYNPDTKKFYFGGIELSKLSDLQAETIGNPEHVLKFDPDTETFYFGAANFTANFRTLGDVEGSSVGNPDHLLRYNPTTEKFYFDYLSGDQGKINSLTFEDSGPQVTPVPGMIACNHNEDCLDIYQNDGSTCQVGLENYIEVYNGTSNPIPHGTVVRFAGVYGFNGWIKPSVDLFVADSNAIPEYIVGVLTTNLEPGQTGRATTLGKVRELNTTGSTVGEVWQVGDILYAHPSIPGELTKNKPTAPNVAVSVAAVLKVSDTIGVLLVRPIIFPRLYYGGWYSSVNQTPGTLNAPHAVTFNNQDPTSGFHIEDGMTIVAENSGLYNFQFSLQVSANTSSLGNVWIWYRKNGVDVAHSSTQVSIASNGFNVAPAWNFLVSLNAGETFELYWATNRANVFLAADPATAFCPSTPSAILTVTQVNQ